MWQPSCRPFKVRPCSQGQSEDRRASVSKRWPSACPSTPWRTITWREGTKRAAAVRAFARVRVRVCADPGRSTVRRRDTAHRNGPRARPRPPNSGSPHVDRKHVVFAALSTPPSCAGASSAIITTLKQEIGLGHYEGRGLGGAFHHHGTLSIAAYGFLISERERIPPPLSTTFPPLESKKSAVPSGLSTPRRPRSGPQRHVSQLDRHDPSPVGCRDCNDPSSMPVLHPVAFRGTSDRIYDAVVLARLSCRDQ